MFYSNFSDHSAYRMSGQQQKIEKNDFELSLKLNHLNNKNFDTHYLKDGFYFKIKRNLMIFNLIKKKNSDHKKIILCFHIRKIYQFLFLRSFKEVVGH